MAMEQQMEMFGANPMGGLDDDGLSRDPVSGNEIPPGSMANEVRDDVDARLSDGEYVVPANVVRFFGVKFFEELRTQAMQGLDTMEANGRIGGEPMPSDMPMQDQMAGSPEELSEQDMAMLQNLMSQGGDVRGYAHGGYHDPVNDPQPIPQSIPSSVFPLTQYATPGASTVLPSLNPNLPPSAITATPDDLPLETNNPEFRFVTMVNPVNGNIQVVQFKGDVPVDANAYNQLINSGFYVQGSPELAAYNQQQEQDNNNQERQQSVQDGTKPANRQTVGELLWSAQTGIYNEVFPDSLSAGISKLGSFGALGQLGKVLPDGPSRLEQSIREAEARLERGKDYQGVAINAAEKAALELLISFKGEKDMTKVYDAIYNAYEIHTGGKSNKYKRNIGIPDIKNADKNSIRKSNKAITKAGKALSAKERKILNDPKGTFTSKAAAGAFGSDDFLTDTTGTVKNRQGQTRQEVIAKQVEKYKDTPDTFADIPRSEEGENRQEKEKEVIEKQTAIGQATGKGYVGGSGFKAGGLLKKPTKKKTKKY